MEIIKDYIHLYSNCRVVKGARRSVLWNLSSGNFELIPNDLAGLIDSLGHTRVLDIYASYGKGSKPVLDSYFKLIATQGYGFYSDAPSTATAEPSAHFDQCDFPFRVANAVIDFNGLHVNALKPVIKQLAATGCHTLQVRFFDGEQPEVVQDIIEYASGLRAFQGLSVVCDVLTGGLADESALKLLLHRFPLITELVLFNAGAHRFMDGNKLGCSVLYIPGPLSEKSCGCIGPFYFNRQKTHYAESLQHNTCLNRKISIDRDGNIKNCPSMKAAYGNIYDTSLEAALEDPEFLAYWQITKDQISTCKDCEFRHMCTDCRAYLDDPADRLSKPLKCGYNPYDGSWQDWSQSVYKDQAITFYGLND